MTGKEILESWNCFTLSRLHSAAGTVAVLMMLMELARTRCREAISWYICSNRTAGMRQQEDVAGPLVFPYFMQEACCDKLHEWSLFCRCRRRAASVS